MIESHDYHVQLVSTSAKTAVVNSIGDALPTLNVASLLEFGGPGATWSPEHLFVASIASCLMTTFHVIADISGLEVLEYSDDAIGHLQRGEDRLYRIDRVTLLPRIAVGNETEVPKALKLIDKAKEVCLISRSVSADIEMRATIAVAERVGR